VISEYFATDWVANMATRAPMPVVLNLGLLYDALLSGIMARQPIATTGFDEVGRVAFDHGRPAEPLAERVQRMELIRAKTRDVERIKARLAREKQFNKRVGVNAELRAAKLELERLTGATAPMTAPK
jgi:hypothetical protein